ncbi:hypothetical protein, partial [Rhizobium sp. SEMIA 4088]|uniref:hypothetical protein n=2 Tax=unclassified Rhizobium TaxID=2613769 RepID=UPI001AEC5878
PVMQRQPQQRQHRIVDLVFVDIHCESLSRANTKLMRYSPNAYQGPEVQRFFDHKTQGPCPPEKERDVCITS